MLPFADKEELRQEAINDNFEHLAKILYSKTGIRAHIYWNIKNKHVYIIVDEKYYKLDPIKYTVEETLKHIFNLKSTRVFMTKTIGKKIKISNIILSWDWKKIRGFDNYIEFDFMGYFFRFINLKNGIYLHIKWYQVKFLFLFL